MKVRCANSECSREIPHASPIQTMKVYCSQQCYEVAKKKEKQLSLDLYKESVVR